ncbi:MAG TPA: pseudouridine synthase [Bryobacteraceae bacterium]|nr:pseudouridine synthase [Bryobacteraceae bacterium]
MINPTRSVQQWWLVVAKPALYRYILFNKPYGVLTQFSGGESRRTLKDFIPVTGVYPVGRLDQDSEGLLLLTDDGWMQHRLTDPKFEHPKTYLAQVEGVPDEMAIRRLETGVLIAGYRTRPAKVRLCDAEPDLPPRDPPVRTRKSIPTTWLEITLTEGRNRQVRRMTAAVGYPTLRLVRVAIGNLRIDDLAPGKWRDLTAAELARLGR